MQRIYSTIGLFRLPKKDQYGKPTITHRYLLRKCYSVAKTSYITSDLGHIMFPFCIHFSYTVFFTSLWLGLLAFDLYFREDFHIMIPLYKQINSAFAIHPFHTFNSTKFSKKPQKRLDFTIILLHKPALFPQEIVQA
mgnify:CR=1 FL=1